MATPSYCLFQDHTSSVLRITELFKILLFTPSINLGSKVAKCSWTSKGQPLEAETNLQKVEFQHWWLKKNKYGGSKHRKQKLSKETKTDNN